MKNLFLLFVLLGFLSCESKSSKEPKTKLNKDLVAVNIQISDLMANHHYNPNELSSNEYLLLEKKTDSLARSVQTQEEFIEEFNAIWRDGPFSHVLLSKAQKPAAQMADFIDSMRVGPQGANLKWMGKTAVLTVNTMTGLDTFEFIFEAYEEISKKEANALIIDVRNNTGGTFAILPLVGHVLTDSLDTGYFVSRKWWTNNSAVPHAKDVQKLTPWQGWSIKSFWHDVQEKPLTRVKFGPMDPYYDGPVYVLTSKISASATEFAVDALATINTVTIIGETTAGEMLSQKMYDLSLDLQLSLPIAEYYSTRIGRIEGKGVNPDIEIDQSTSLDLAISLINGEKLDQALSRLQKDLEDAN